jgi:hypothetical protein
MAQATATGSRVQARTVIGITPQRRVLDASVRRFGFWASVATAATYIVFLVGYGIGSSLRPPWDIRLPVGASILIAPCFVLLMVGVHHATAESKRIWSHAALAFALLYAAFVSIVYITWTSRWAAESARFRGAHTWSSIKKPRPLALGGGSRSPAERPLICAVAGSTIVSVPSCEEAPQSGPVLKLPLA